MGNYIIILRHEIVDIDLDTCYILGGGP